MNQLIFIEIAHLVLNGKIFSARNKAMDIACPRDRQHALNIIGGNCGN